MPGCIQYAEMFENAFTLWLSSATLVPGVKVRGRPCEPLRVWVSVGGPLSGLFSANH